MLEIKGLVLYRNNENVEFSWMYNECCYTTTTKQKPSKVKAYTSVTFS